VTDITLTTSDDVAIAATYYPVAQPHGWVVYSHMMSSDRSSFAPLAIRLSRAGYAGIAIDLRGHGQSQEGPDGYLEFSDIQHQESVRDIQAAVDFLVQEGAKTSEVILVGASIGANLSLVHALQGGFAGVVALSPGLSYKGIDVTQVALSYASSVPVMLVSSTNDPNVLDNDTQTTRLASLLGNDVVAEMIESAVPYHGTDILVHDKSIEDRIVLFITNQ
jgi:alpha-beta hydrolase superfamily lysophospholipase